MSTSCIAMGLVVIAALGALSSEAATLPFSAQLQIEIVAPQYTVPGAGSGTGMSIGGGTAQIPPNVFTISYSQLVPPPLYGGAVCAPGLPNGTPLTVPSSNGACPVGQAATSGALNFNGVTGTLGLNGSLYFTDPSFLTDQEVPLAVFGVGGSQNFIFFGQPATVTGNPWQLGTVTANGFLNGLGPLSLSATGFDSRASNGTGTLRLVTPAFANISGLGTAPAVGILTLTFVPEPGTFLLLSAGLVGLAAVRTRRHRT